MALAQPFSLWLSTHYSGIICGEKWLEKTVPGKKCLDEIQERKRNFMNIIPSTCFKRSFIATSCSRSSHFPGIASCLHLSSGGKTIVFEMSLMKWNIGQSWCHILVWGTIGGGGGGGTKDNYVLPSPIKVAFSLWWRFCSSK